MCGDIEEDGRLEADPLLARFLSNARRILERPPVAVGPGNEEAALHGYLDRLFADALGRSLRDAGEVDAGEGYQRLAMQSLVFARLAGYIAGHVRLKEDPMRKLVEAMMLGYSEADEDNLAGHPRGGHDHHDHDHSHGHHH